MVAQACAAEAEIRSANGWVASTTASTAFSLEPARERVRAAEAARADRAVGQPRVGHAAGERGGHGDALGDERGRQRAGLGRAPEHEDH